MLVTPATVRAFHLTTVDLKLRQSTLSVCHCRRAASVEESQAIEFIVFFFFQIKKQYKNHSRRTSTPVRFQFSPQPLSSSSAIVLCICQCTLVFPLKFLQSPFSFNFFTPIFRYNYPCDHRLKRAPNTFLRTTRCGTTATTMLVAVGTCVRCTKANACFKTSIQK